MKDFFKRNLVIIILLAVGIVALFIGTTIPVCLSIGSAIVTVPFVMLTVRSKKKYNTLLDYDDSKDYFDATKLDYDEEVYYIGSESQKKSMIKGKLSKFNALTPTFLYGILSLSFAFMAVYSFIKIVL